MNRLLLAPLLVLGLTVVACEARRTDQAISEDFARLAKAEPDLRSADVRAITEDGRVTLRGFVNTEHARESAEDLAEEIAGVKDVKNEVQVVAAAGRGARAHP